MQAMLVAAKKEREDAQAIKSGKSADDKSDHTQDHAQNADSHAPPAPVVAVTPGTSSSKVATIIPRSLSHGLKEKAKEVCVTWCVCVLGLKVVWQNCLSGVYYVVPCSLRCK